MSDLNEETKVDVALRWGAVGIFFCTALAGTLFGLSGEIREIIKAKGGLDSTDALITLVSLMALGLAFERVGVLEKLRAKLDVLLLRDIKNVTAISLRDASEVETYARGLIKSCNDNSIIQATGQFPKTIDSDGLGAGYFREVAEKMRQAVAAKHVLTYTVVVPDGPEEKTMAAIERRLVPLVEAEIDWQEVRVRFHVKFSRENSPLDVLIVGQTMIVAFSGMAGHKYNFGVLLNQGTDTNTFGAWYNSAVLKEASDKPSWVDVDAGVWLESLWTAVGGKVKVPAELA